MNGEEPLLGPFQPEQPPPTNGSRIGRRRGPSAGGVTFGVLVGALLAVSLVGRVQWLNLATVGWWGRPVLAAGFAGVMAGSWRARDARGAAAGGALAALLALWGVYGIMRLGTGVVFVERSIARVVAADLLRLAAYAVPAGAVGALVPLAVQRRVAQMGDRRPATGR